MSAGPRTAGIVIALIGAMALASPAVADIPTPTPSITSTWSAAMDVPAGHLDHQLSTTNQIFTDGSTAIRVWAEQLGNPSADFVQTTIRTRSSHDGGVTWSDAKTLSSENEMASLVGVGKASNGAIVVVWSEFRYGDSGSGEEDQTTVRTRSTGDDGTTWLSPSTLSTPSGSFSAQFIALSGGRLVVALTGGGSAVQTIVSTDGSAWTPGATLTTNERMFPVDFAAGPKGELFVAWRSVPASVDNSSVRFARSTDGLASWSAPFELQDASGTAYLGGLAATKNRLVVIIPWSDGQTGSLRSRTSTDGGVSWSDAVAIVGPTMNSTFSGELVVAKDDRFTVVWTRSDTLPTRPTVTVVTDTVQSSSSADGTGWSPVIALTTTAHAIDRQIAVSLDGTVDVAWRLDQQPYTGRSHITTVQTLSSIDGGLSWSPMVAFDTGSLDFLRFDHVGMNTVALSWSGDFGVTARYATISRPRPVAGPTPTPTLTTMPEPSAVTGFPVALAIGGALFLLIVVAAVVALVVIKRRRRTAPDSGTKTAEEPVVD